MKKKVIKPFDLEKAKNGAKVETKEGFPVDILCFDANLVQGFQIVGIVNATYGGSKGPVVKRFVMTWWPDGTFSKYDDGKASLVLVEEQEVPSVTKKEVKEHLQWFVDNADCLIEGLGAKVYEKLLSMVIAMRTAYRVKDDDIIIDKDEEKHENVKYCVLKLEGLENMPAEGIAMAYVRDAVGSANKALGYSAKERNAFSWQKVWRNQGCFGVIDEENAKKIAEKCPDFQFRLYYKSNITSDDHGKA